MLSGLDLTTEAAVTKMMYALGKAKGNAEEAKRIITSVCVGEMSV